MLTDDPTTPPRPAERCPYRVQALFEGHLLADSGDVYLQRDAEGEPVYFFPRRDVEMEVLQASDLRTRTVLGEAHHFTIMRDRKIVDDIAWTYPAASDPTLADRITFSPADVEFHVTTTPADRLAEPPSFDPSTSRGDVDEVVRHTDSGSGLGQEEAWEPTVSEPARPDPDKPYSGVGSI